MVTSDLTVIFKKISEATDKAIKDFPIARDEAIKKAIESNEKAVREFTSGLQGLTTWSHPIGTNVYTLGFKSPMDMIRAASEFSKNPKVTLYYTRPDQTI